MDSHDEMDADRRSMGDDAIILMNGGSLVSGDDGGSSRRCEMERLQPEEK